MCENPFSNQYIFFLENCTFFLSESVNLGLLILAVAVLLNQKAIRFLQKVPNPNIIFFKKNFSRVEPHHAVY